MTVREKFRNTAYTEKTSESYIINSAVAYTEVEFAEGEFKGKLLGATAGGVNLNITPEYEDIEIDGTSHMKVKGNKKLVSATAVLTANMKELTANVLAQSLNAKLVDAPVDVAPAGYKTINMSRYIEESSYVENVAFVGKISGTDKPIIVILDNALVTSEMALETTDNSEAVVSLEFEAHASVEQLHDDKWPWTILYPEVA